MTQRIWLAAALVLMLVPGCTKAPAAVFSGKISNDPEKVTTVTVGQAVSARPATISDWMYVDHGKLVGGYTLRVLRDRFSSDRAEFDRSIPFKVE